MQCLPRSSGGGDSANYGGCGAGGGIAAAAVGAGAVAEVVVVGVAGDSISFGDIANARHRGIETGLFRFVPGKVL